MKMSNAKRTIITALCSALCVLLPMAFHSIPGAGGIFLPMHIPVLLCGLICGAPFGLICGAVGPLLSSLLTGMPAMAYLPSMVIELVVYGFVAGLAMHLVRTKITLADLYIALIAAQLCGRVVAGLSRALIFAAGEYSFTVWTASYFVTALPGLVLQLVLLPAIVFALMQARLIPLRYPIKK